MDLNTVEGLEALRTKIIGDLRKEVTKFGTCGTKAILIITKDAHGSVLNAPGLALVLPSDNGFDRFLDSVKNGIRVLRASGYFLISPCRKQDSPEQKSVCMLVEHHLFGTKLYSSTLDIDNLTSFEEVETQDVEGPFAHLLFKDAKEFLYSGKGGVA